MAYILLMEQSMKISILLIYMFLKQLHITWCSHGYITNLNHEHVSPNITKCKCTWMLPLADNLDEIQQCVMTREQGGVGCRGESETI